MSEEAWWVVIAAFGAGGMTFALVIYPRMLRRAFQAGRSTSTGR